MLRVLITVTHLLGAGHLTRAAALARAFSSAGHDATLVSGGMPSPLISLDRVNLVQLPAIKTAGTDFRTLLDVSGRPVDEAFLTARKNRLLQALEESRPNLVITELFPFGRRVLASEFMALLEAARRTEPRPVVACSIRDILVAPVRHERIVEAHERLIRLYDAVFVHGDPSLAALDASWPVDDAIRPLLHYTGYVDEGSLSPGTAPRRGILVSGGSSAASLPLYRAAIGAAEHIVDRPWRILVGRSIAEDDFSAIKASTPSHVDVERARPDFRDLLARAEVSVSQAGYNTAVDLLRAGVPAVLVPFEAGHETEQRLRAERMKCLGLAEIVPEDDLSAERLAQAVRSSLTRTIAASADLALDGAARTVSIAEGLVGRVPALHHGLDWSPFQSALRQARDEGVSLSFWWRDDDAVAHTPSLDRLLDLARRSDAGLALAVVPDRIEPSLAWRLDGERCVDVLVHGLTHKNHAPENEKKAEFGGHRPSPILAAEASKSLRLAQEQLGRSLLPVFVPPWNRIAPSLVQTLPDLGFKGLSAFGNRRSRYATPGLVQINTHVDPIDWHGSRSLADPDLIIASLAHAVHVRRSGDADARESIGFLTHHLVHDEAVWSFCERLLEELFRNNIRMRRGKMLFLSECGSPREDDAL